MASCTSPLLHRPSSMATAFGISPVSFIFLKISSTSSGCAASCSGGGGFVGSRSGCGRSPLFPAAEVAAASPSLSFSISDSPMGCCGGGNGCFPAARRRMSVGNAACGEESSGAPPGRRGGGGGGGGGLFSGSALKLRVRRKASSSSSCRASRITRRRRSPVE
ncbi:Os01g0546600 [Oryza sativa Japonica Group]|uniref:Os01g0546600 protein n=1 Tax=Oryza sativa subsp. japonica TaxID=39947 RepID=Q0JM31_ORYSJ|nr:Os01g0546600 [Oryza sativa Japonica Group]|eukprot:NP_001043283.1 Os01g0546600 [Oryza sativa Japonica Group]